MKDLITTMATKLLPIYISITPTYTLALWSGPTIPVRNSWDYLKALRITIRKDGSPVFVIKKGWT